MHFVYCLIRLSRHSAPWNTATKHDN